MVISSGAESTHGRSARRRALARAPRGPTRSGRVLPGNGGRGGSFRQTRLCDSQRVLRAAVPTPGPFLNRAYDATRCLARWRARMLPRTWGGTPRWPCASLHRASSDRARQPCPFKGMWLRRMTTLGASGMPLPSMCSDVQRAPHTGELAAFRLASSRLSSQLWCISAHIAEPVKPENR